jgi:hypothetical protein
LEGLGLLIILGVFVFYMLPTVICNVRKTEHQDAIALINLLLGWTVLGWIAALIWAIVEKPRTWLVKENRQTCQACKSLIHEQATICPHCRTAVEPPYTRVHTFKATI